MKKFKKEFTVEEFLAAYKKRGTSELRKKFVKDYVEVVDYVPFLTKVARAEHIAKASFFKNFSKNTETGKGEWSGIHINSQFKYISLYCTIIELWTNINVDLTKIVETYDMLQSEDLFSEILKKIPEREVAEFNSLVEMNISDLYENNLNTKILISEQCNRFLELFSTIFSPLGELLVEKAKKIDKKDIKKIMDEIHNKVYSSFPDETKQ